MNAPPLLIIVLAAGKGTRMKSALPKVLHKIAGRSMLGHVLALAHSANAQQLATVVGPDMPAVEAEAKKLAPASRTFIQHQQQGTADAVLAAREAIKAHKGDVIVLYADTPLIRAETITRLTSCSQSARIGRRAK
jgi:bifunctional UDP-N-acetylglucosamine pyrophosphorylase / glucosamine-1-phosphate N-acetyltransferase